jgi:hypothetical protein
MFDIDGSNPAKQITTGRRQGSVQMLPDRSVLIHFPKTGDKNEI